MHPENAKNLQLIFELYAYQGLTLDGVINEMERRGRKYKSGKVRFPKQSVQRWLNSRAYLGEHWYDGEWHPGTHEPLITLETWNRVQARLRKGERVSNMSVYGGQLIRCGHCGRIVTSEVVRKKYTYYRCSGYTAPGHPRIRLPERKLDEQILGYFKSMRITDETRQWFRDLIQKSALSEREVMTKELAQLRNQTTRIQKQQGKLLEAKLSGEYDDLIPEVYQEQVAGLRSRHDQIRSRIASLEAHLEESGDTAIKAFELSQALVDKWLAADAPEKRRILDLVFLNFTLDDVTLDPESRKPFDALIEGPSVSFGRTDWIRTSDLYHPKVAL